MQKNARNVMGQQDKAQEQLIQAQASRHQI